MLTEEIKGLYLNEIRLPLHLKSEGNGLSKLKDTLEDRGIKVPYGSNPRSLFDNEKNKKNKKLEKISRLEILFRYSKN
jgi:hypothetical protein